VLLPFSKRAKEWEPTAAALRKLLNLAISDALDPWQLAPKVGLTVFDGHAALRAVSEDASRHLLGLGRSKWSGGVYPCPLPDNTYLCILNPTHSTRRNKITLMEEIVHIHVNHKPSGLILLEDGIRIRSYDKAQEEQAFGIGAAALLPWKSFFDRVNGGCSLDELADDFDVTPDLIEYRIKITGAFVLYRARQRNRTSQSNPQKTSERF
jgi:hypothetical protein